MGMPYKLPRGLRSALASKISAATIILGQLYHVTDENRISLGTSTNTVVDFAKRSDDYFDVTNISPGLPISGAVRIYRSDSGGRGMLRITGADGDFYTAQPHIGKNNPHWIIPSFGSTTPVVEGITGLTNLGNPTSRTWASTSRFTRNRRLGYVSAATAASFAGFYSTNYIGSVGDSGTGSGGFHYIVRFGVSDATLVTSTKMFIGLSNSIVAPTNVEINTLTNAVGIGKLSTSSNLCVYCAGTSAQAVLDLGTSYPADNTNTDSYEFALFSPSSNTSITWTLNRFLSNGTQTTTSGTFVTSSAATGPASSVGLAPRVFRMTPTTTAVGIDLTGMYIETDI